MPDEQTRIERNIEQIFERINALALDVNTLTAQGKTHTERYGGFQVLHDTQLVHEHRLINIEEAQKAREIQREEEARTRKAGVNAWQMWVALIVISVVEEVLKRVLHLS